MNVEVVAVLEEAANDTVVVVPWLSEPDEALYEDVLSMSLFFLAPLTLRSITSEIKPGFVILLSLISISLVSILTTEDMVGRSLGVS